MDVQSLGKRCLYASGSGILINSILREDKSIQDAEGAHAPSGGNSACKMSEKLFRGTTFNQFVMDLGLQNYLNSLHDLGYDDLNTVVGMSEGERSEMCKLAHMKPGHQMKFLVAARGLTGGLPKRVRRRRSRSSKSSDSEQSALSLSQIASTEGSLTDASGKTNDEEESRVVMAKSSVLHEFKSHLQQHAEKCEQKDVFSTTLLECSDMLLTEPGGVVFVIVDKEMAECLPFKRLDNGLLTTIWRNLAPNICEDTAQFRKVLSVFCAHNDSDRWEDHDLGMLASIAGCSSVDEAFQVLPELASLKGRPKDGALVVSLRGSVLAAAANLKAPGSWHLIRCDGLPVGTRHAAALNMAGWLGSSGVDSAVLVRSDSGGVHALLPCGMDVPAAWSISTTCASSTEEAQSIGAQSSDQKKAIVHGSNQKQSVPELPMVSDTPQEVDSGQNKERKKEVVMGPTVSLEVAHPVDAALENSSALVQTIFADEGRDRHELLSGLTSVGLILRKCLETPSEYGDLVLKSTELRSGWFFAAYGHDLLTYAGIRYENDCFLRPADLTCVEIVSAIITSALDERARAKLSLDES